MTAATTGIVNLVFWTAQQAVLLDKKISPWMVKKVLQSARYTWRRVRKSMKKQRDEGLFDFFKQELVELAALEKQGLIRLWFYDESGFHLNPNAIYAWLPPQGLAKDLELPAQRGNVLTLAGFLRHDNTLEAYSQQGPMTALCFIAFVEDFIQNQVQDAQIKNIVIIDNASFHTAHIVKQKMIAWKKHNLYFQFIPPYCSELNHIEILWRFIKNQWLTIQDYNSALELKNAVINIIKSFGSKYTINYS